MKTLSDFCLLNLASNIARFPNLDRKLPPLHKQHLLRMLADRDLYTPQNIPYIISSLITRNLKVLTLHNCEQIDDVMLKNFARSGCRLYHLTLSSCPNVTDQGMCSVTICQCDLKQIKLSDLPKTERGVISHVRSLFLRKIELISLPGLQSAEFYWALKRSPCIKEVVIRNCNSLDTYVVKDIGEALKTKLEVLEFTDNTRNPIPPASSMRELLEHTPNMKRCIMPGYWQGDAFTDYRGTIKLGLHEVLSAWKHLEELVLNGPHLVSLERCNQLPEHLPKSLHTLTLDEFPYEDNCLSFIQHVLELPSVGKLTLNHVANPTNALDQLMPDLGPGLYELNLLKMKLTADDLDLVAEYCPNLSILNLNSITPDSDASLLPIFGNKDRAEKLESLHLNSPWIENEVLQAILTNCCNLTSLTLESASRMDDLSLFMIGDHMQKLTHLNLRKCRNISDWGVEEMVKKCQHLVEVDFGGCPRVGSMSVLTLANNCPYLDTLTLNSRISDHKLLAYLQLKSLRRIRVRYLNV